MANKKGIEQGMTYKQMSGDENTPSPNFLLSCSKLVAIIVYIIILGFEKVSKKGLWWISISNWIR